MLNQNMTVNYVIYFLWNLTHLVCIKFQPVSIHLSFCARVGRAHQVPFTRCAKHFVANVDYILAAYRSRSHTNYFSNDPRQDQDQDSLLVKRRNDNHSPGPVIRDLVPSSHQRSELSNTILCIFSG